MSDEPPSSPRKSSDVTSLRGAVPKRKGKKRSKSPLRFRSPLPFFESDEHSDVTLVVDDKRLYSNKCLLVYNSKVFEKQLGDDGGKGGRGMAKAANKELVLNDKKFDDMVELLAYIDPRVDCELTDQAAMRLAPLAEEYEIKRLQKDCEETLTSSYADMRKGRKSGMVPTETTLKYLETADKYKHEKLLEMCVADCVDNPYIDSRMDKLDDEISLSVQKEILRRKNKKLSYQLSKKTRELEISGDAKKNETRIWRR